MTEETTWKRCSTCKRPIAFACPYFACSVSTCNRKGALFAFCSVACWDGHVPVMRHRDAWAEEATAPTAAEWAREQAGDRGGAPPGGEGAARAPRRVVVGGGEEGAARAGGGAGGLRPAGGGAVPRDVLVVVSKLKAYVRAASGMNTSDDVIDVLSDRLRLLCDDAIERARDAGRKTVMARDFRRS